MNAKFANSTNPQNKHEAQTRRDYLSRSNAEYDFLLAELDNAYSIESCENSRLLRIADMVMQEQRLISGVKAADAKRYAKLPE